MKSFQITFGPRLRLNQILDQISGPIGRLRPILEVLKQTVFTDAEMSQVTQTPQSGGIAFEAPSPDFGTITVNLEDAAAQALVSELENSQSLTVYDLRFWANAILETLQAKS